MKIKQIKTKMEVKPMQKLCINNGKVWEKAELHLKSAIPQFSRYDITTCIELDLLKKQIA